MSRLRVLVAHCLEDRLLRRHEAQLCECYTDDSGFDVVMRARAELVDRILELSDIEENLGELEGVLGG